MNTFDFYQDSKVTCRMRTKFQVKAENYEQAVAIIKSWQGEDVMNHDDEEQVIFVEGETLLEEGSHSKCQSRSEDAAHHDKIVRGDDTRPLRQ